MIPLSPLSASVKLAKALCMAGATHTNSLAKKKKSGRDLTQPVDLERIAAAVREILLAIGEDPDREGLRETPDRVARMYDELFAGLRKDPAAVLRKTFTEKYDEMVLVKNIGFESMCEHHLLPFLGKAHIAYLPQGRIVGLSKVAAAGAGTDDRGDRRPRDAGAERPRRRRRSRSNAHLHGDSRRAQSR
jgi:hypothetical protein